MWPHEVIWVLKKIQSTFKYDRSSGNKHEIDGWIEPMCRNLKLDSYNISNKFKTWLKINKFEKFTIITKNNCICSFTLFFLTLLIQFELHLVKKNRILFFFIEVSDWKRKDHTNDLQTGRAGTGETGTRVQRAGYLRV